MASDDIGMVGKKLESIGVGHIQRHIFLCAGDKCCHPSAGEDLWQYLKQRLKELDLVNKQVFRTKVTCLRVCQQGPVALVYPEGTWYHLLDKNRLERIIQEHLLEGHVVDEFAIAHNPLHPKA